MRNAVIAAVLAVSASTAAAQPALTPPTEPSYGPAPVAAKSESNATALAVGATLAGLAVTVAGAEHGESSVVLGGVALMMIGPSAGHIYAGENGHAAKMSLVRTGALLVLGAGVMTSTMAYDCAAGGGCGGDSRADGEKLMWLGGATLIGATLYDLYDAHNAARRSNERQARAWTVAPSIMASANGGTTPAVAISGAW